MDVERWQQTIDFSAVFGWTEIKSEEVINSSPFWIIFLKIDELLHSLNCLGKVGIDDDSTLTSLTHYSVLITLRLR